MSSLSLLLVFLAVGAEAREYQFTKTVNPALLQAKLTASGFSVDRIVCSGTTCRIAMPDSETKDPAPIVAAHVYEDLRAAAEARKDAAIVLAKKLKAGTITEQEKDQLLLWAVVMLLGDL